MGATTLAPGIGRWVQGVTSNIGAWTLVDHNGYSIAHVYQGRNGSWIAVDDDGVIGEQFPTYRKAISVVISAYS